MRCDYVRTHTSSVCTTTFNQLPNLALKKREVETRSTSRTNAVVWGVGCFRQPSVGLVPLSFAFASRFPESRRRSRFRLL